METYTCIANPIVVAAMCSVTLFILLTLLIVTSANTQRASPPPKLLLLSTTIQENFLVFFLQYLWFFYLSVDLCIYVCLKPHANMVPLQLIETYSVTLWFFLGAIMLPLFCYSLFLSGCFPKNHKKQSDFWERWILFLTKINR